MKLKIKEELPLKYHLNMHLMESVIEMDSIAFEIIKYVDRDIDANEKERILENFKFTSKTLKYIFGDRIKDATFKEYMIVTLKEMISKGWIKPDGKSMYITLDTINKFFKIIK